MKTEITEIILPNYKQVYFVSKVWFDASNFATMGLIKGYCERSGQYRILTKLGHCNLDRERFTI